MAPPGVSPPSPQRRHIPVDQDSPRAASSSGRTSNDRMDTYIVYADPQHGNEPHVMSFYRSPIVFNYAPGLRLAGTNLGAGLTTEALIRENAPPSKSNRPRLIFLGDMVDTNTVGELRSGFRVLDRVKEVDSANRLLIYPPSNHDLEYLGTTNSGHNAGGAVGWGLNLSGSERSHIRNIHGYEAGGVENRLPKDKWLQLIYPRMFQQNATHQDNKTDLRRIGEKDYELTDGREADWFNTGRVAKDFWRSVPGERWNALTVHAGKDTEFPEEKWLYLSAAKLKDIQTKTGVHPVYLISLDTMDFLQASSTKLGVLRGHVSAAQVHLVRAFIAERKRENPRALFVIAGHHPVEDIADFTDSGLNKIFSYDSVLAYLAGHAHRRGYDLLTTPKLAAEYDIQRRQPLPQIIFPSVTDPPQEMALLSLGTAKDNPNKIVLKVEFRGLDENKIPGNLDAEGKTDTLCREMQVVRPELNEFIEYLKRIEDLRIRGIANPHSELIQNLNRVFDIDEGLIFDPDHFHDKVVGQSVVPVMNVRVRVYSYLFTKTIKLLLSEAGLTEMAEKFDRLFTEAIEHSSYYYDLLRYRGALQRLKTEILERGEELPPDVVKADRKLEAQLKTQVQRMNALRRRLEVMVPEVVQACTFKGRQDDSNAYQQGLLKTARASMNDLKVFMQEYQSWLKHYETTRKVLSNDSEILNDLDIFSRRSFRDLFQRLSAVPYGSQAAAFLIHVSLESSEQYKVYYKGVEALRQKVPDRIQLEIATHTNERTLIPSPFAKLDVPIQRRQWCVKPGEYQDYAMQDRDAAANLPKEENKRPVEAHWNVQPNVFFGHGAGFHGGLSLEVGSSHHLWRRWDKWYGADLLVHVEGLLGWQGRTTFNTDGQEVFGARVSGELNLKIAPSLSAFSLVSLAPQILFGIGRKGLGDAFPSDEAHYGYGARLQLLEGALGLQYIRQLSTDKTKVNRYMAGFDVIAIGRELDWWDRDL